ncbi:Hypothetical_protein [Hexamita inflata]|uniref:Hypothetical_protein n=1 Tax=Hexamita inflata TaxID=28002 RepID=A0AA86UIA0_9EUKA|nr:Hypothetical protein HINF_LOCUS46965 [Hexamita inflata]
MNLQTGSQCTSNSQCKSNGCYLNIVDKRISNCADYSIGCGSDYPTYDPTTQHGVCWRPPGFRCYLVNSCAFQCCSIVSQTYRQCSSAILDCQPGYVAALQSVSSTVPFCIKQTGEDCISGTECLMQTCYPSINNLLITKCAPYSIICDNEQVQLYYDNTTSTCKLLIGKTCQNIKYSNNCINKACYQTIDDVLVYKCSIQIICNVKEVQLYISTELSICKLKITQICAQNSDCVTKACYQTIPDQSIYKCSQQVSCEQNQIPVFIDKLISQCKFSNGEVCASSVDCVSQQCYVDISSLNINRCSSLISCNLSEIQIFQDKFNSVCKYINGEVCTIYTQCASQQCYIDSSDYSIYRCSKYISCDPVIEVQVFSTLYISSCKKMLGEQCQQQQDCLNQTCYLTLNFNIKKCAIPIQCDENQTPIYLSNNESNCKLKNGQICSKISDCLSQVCYQTLDNSSVQRCGTPKICTLPNIPYFLNISISVCLNPGGQICLSNDETCAYNCFSYQSSGSFLCSNATAPSCSSQQVGVIQTADYLVKCYLISNELCDQSTDLCQFTCLKDLDSNSFKCSSSLITCSGSYLPYIQSLIPVCKLADGLECTSDSECLSNSCYPVLKSTCQKCASGSIDCSSQPGKIPALDSQNTPICVLNTGSTCFIEGPTDSCFSGVCAQLKNNPSTLKCASVSSTCLSCESSQICVSDQNNIGSCLQIDGTICTSDGLCANSCLLSLENTFICSVPCSLCSADKCVSEQTGKEPVCKNNVVSRGTIVGIVIAVFIVIISFVLLVICAAKRRKQKQLQTECKITRVLLVE